MEHQETNKEVINLVIARLRTIPSDANILVGTNENDSFNATDLIEEVKNQTDIGKDNRKTTIVSSFERLRKDMPSVLITAEIRRSNPLSFLLVFGFDG